jgi:hypothetical protein
MYSKDPLGVLLRCLYPEEEKQIMTKFHGILCGAHHLWRTATYNILRFGYLWPNVFTNVCAKIRTCDKCKKFSGKKKLKYLPLKPIVVYAPFQ